MAMSVGTGEEGAPMVDMNTTPLIDVMLVLLIMFIITIPVQTHAVKLDLPQTPTTPPPDQPKPDFNTVEVDFLGQVYFNKTPVTIPRLAADLKAAVAMRPEPETRLHPDAQAKYAIVDQVMATAQQAGVTKMGFVGNEAYANQ